MNNDVTPAPAEWWAEKPAGATVVIDEDEA